MDLKRFSEIPFVDGRADWGGVDCYGLGVLLNCVIGKTIPRHPTGVTRHTPGDAAEAFTAGRAAWPEIERGSERLGDAVIIRQPGHVGHVGWVVAPGRLIHATSQAGVVSTTFEDPDIKHRILSIHRYE